MTAGYGSRWTLLFAAWLVAVAASLSALFISEVMGQAACSLCWLQRAFMFPLAIILGIAALNDDLSVTRYALPLSLLGCLVAGYHSLLYAGFIEEGIVPCTANGPSCSDSGMTILGSVPIPLLSARCFIIIAALLGATRRRNTL